jgi:hypothetical protein
MRCVAIDLSDTVCVLALYSKIEPEGAATFLRSQSHGITLRLRVQALTVPSNTKFTKFRAV